MMDHIDIYYPYDLADAETNHCDNILSKDEACRNKTLECLEHMHKHAQENHREENQR